MNAPASSSLSHRILALLTEADYQPLDDVGLSKKLGIKSDDRSKVRRALRELEERGAIARVRRDRYVLPEEAELVTGIIQIHPSGNAHLLSQRPGQPDLYISAENTWTAMPGDTVLARIHHVGRPSAIRRKAAPAGQPEGRVIRILKRAHDTMVGTLQRSKKFHYVIPDDPRFNRNFYVRPSQSPLPKPPEVGDKVVVRLDEWESRHINPEGEIVEVLGAASDPGVDMLSIIRKFHLPVEFPEEVIRQAEALNARVSPAELRRREDLRAELIYTIDPDDARDFDDAVQVEKTANGWRLGVHIADVSHYVTPGSHLDKEASLRGNSVYLPDRVIPMLPERLSNGVCSLKPKVERLTRSVFIEFSRDGKMKKARFSRSVIRSVARLTYRQAFALLSGKTPEPLPVTVPDRTEEIPPEVAENIHQAWELASLLRKNRFAAGSLDLDFPEVKVWLDREGVPVRLEKIENDISHQLIEEFMLAANEAVARETRNRQFPSVYRIHEDPDPEKLAEFRELAAHYGFKAGDLTHRAEVQRLLVKIKASHEEYSLKIAFLRSLKRATYAGEPLGHYGLAKVNYTHFTSPIRRYADLVVHRVIDQIEGKRQKLAAAAIPDIAAHLSRTERNAEEAEREAVKLKKIEFFMLAAERQERFEAVVTEVRNYGLFVELPEFLVSGLIHVSSLAGDFYTFDPIRHRFIGRQKRETFNAGDRLQVAVVKVDIYKQQIDFEPVAILAQSGSGEKAKGGRKTDRDKSQAKGTRSKGKPQKAAPSREKKNAKGKGNENEPARKTKQKPVKKPFAKAAKAPKPAGRRKR
ncbi:MAG TPA: ribonuclease R [Chthoniobacteraceae bacterium]|nr:ribonuclease R [Chthoniobacteraceae bacterium]